ERLHAYAQTLAGSRVSLGACRGDGGPAGPVGTDNGWVIGCAASLRDAARWDAGPVARSADHHQPDGAPADRAGTGPLPASRDAKPTRRGSGSIIERDLAD